MYDFAVDGQYIVKARIPQDNIILQLPIDGLDDCDRRVNIESNTGADGATATGAFFDKRLVRLQGQIAPGNSVLHDAARKRLSSIFRLSRDAYNQPIMRRITFTTLGGDSYFFDAVIPEKPSMTQKYINVTDFMVQLVAPDPFLYGPTEIVSSPITIASGGGFIAPVVGPIISTAPTGGSVTVTNDGNVEASPIIDLTGPLTWPTVYNYSTGKYTRLEYTIAAGETVRIDTKARTIKLNNSSSLMYAKTFDSSFWKLPEGSSTIQLTTLSSSDTGNAVVRFYTPYAGS